MRTHYDAIYLAPHPDDAALSCGGQIHRATAVGKKVLIVTIMAGDPPPDAVTSDFVRELHERWQLAVDAAAIRRQEDGALRVVIPANTSDWQTHIIPLQPADLTAKANAIAAYNSQVSTFFKDHQDLAQQIQKYTQQVGGERLWQHSITSQPKAGE